MGSLIVQARCATTTRSSPEGGVALQTSESNPLLQISTSEGEKPEGNPGYLRRYRRTMCGLVRYEAYGPSVKGGLSRSRTFTDFPPAAIAKPSLTPRLVCDEYRKSKLAAICLFLREMLIRLEAGFGRFQRGVLRHIPLRCRFVCGGIGCTLQRKDRQSRVRQMTTGQITCRRRNGAIFLRRSIHYWRPDARPVTRVGKSV